MKPTSFRFAALAGILLCSAIMLGLLCAPAGANIYATDLKFSAIAAQANGSNTVDLQFRLNEAASNVDIEIWRATPAQKVRSVTLGAKPRGLNTYTWDMRDDASQLLSGAFLNTAYYFKVIASSTGHSAWDQISDPNDLPGKFEYPHMIDVNQNPSSPYFGRIYVWERRDGTTASPVRTVTRGLYALNADMTDAIGQGDTGVLGGITWDTTYTFDDPFHIAVGPEDKVYIFSALDAHSGAWVADPTLSKPFKPIMDAISSPSSVPSPPAVHGGVPSGVVVGKGLNRTLYTIDEDMTAPGDTAAAVECNIWKYNLGPLDIPVSEPPELFWHNKRPQTVVNSYDDLARDAAGNFFIAQYRYGGTDKGSILKIGPTGADTPLWNSLASWGNPDPLRGNYSGIRIDNTRGRIVTAGTIPGLINVFPTSLDIAGLVTISTDPTPGDGNPVGVAFDAVGNVYAVDNVEEQVFIFSPPDGANSYTTTSYGRFVPTNSSSTAPPSTPVFTTDPPYTTSLTQLDAAWSSTGAAKYLYAIGVTAEDQGEYVVGWTDVGASTSITKTGLSLINGVTYFWYVQAISATGVPSAIAVSNGTFVGTNTIGGAKTLGNNKTVTLENVVVTKTDPVFFFAQEQNRSAGIRFVSNANPSVGSKVTVVGTMGTDGPERIINATSVSLGTPFTPAPPLLTNEPLAITQKAAAGSGVTGGTGQKNDGLLVKVWGKVTKIGDIGTNVFYLDDGSGIANDTSGPAVLGIKVIVPDWFSLLPSPPAIGEYWTVKGIVRLFDTGSGIITYIDVSDNADVERASP